LDELGATGRRFLVTVFEARTSPGQVIVTTRFILCSTDREASAGTPENEKSSAEQPIPSA
jgi:hypothetical protein